MIKKKTTIVFKYLHNWVVNSFSLSALSVAGVMFREQGFRSKFLLHFSFLRRSAYYLYFYFEEEVHHIYYFSAVFWRGTQHTIILCRLLNDDDIDDQFRCPIMNDRDNLVGKSSTSVLILTSLQCHSRFIAIVWGMTLEWGEGYDDSAVWVTFLFRH